MLSKEAVARAICCRGECMGNSMTPSPPCMFHLYYTEAEAAIRAVIEGLMEPSNIMLNHGHADGVRADMIWESIDYAMALRLQQKYLPAALRAALRAELRRVLGEQA